MRTPVGTIFKEATYMNKKFKRRVKKKGDLDNRLDFTYKKRTDSNFRRLCSLNLLLPVAPAIPVVPIIPIIRNLAVVSDFKSHVNPTHPNKKHLALNRNSFTG